MRSLLNSALVVSLLCALSAAQTAQPSSPKSRKIPAQKPGAGREITPQQERAISVLNNLFERTKEFADDKTRIETHSKLPGGNLQKLFVRLSESRMKSVLFLSHILRRLFCGFGYRICWQSQMRTWPKS